MNKRKAAILAALQPAVKVAMDRRASVSPRSDVPGLALRKPVAEGAPAELMIYGRIGGGSWFDEGISAADVAALVREAGPSTPLNVRINSGGGDVFDGVAIHSLLARHTGTVTVYVDGLAASAASFIAMAGDKLVMARNGFMMIHDGMTMTYGNGNTHRSAGDLLDKVSDNIADMYAERAGEDVAYWRNLMTVNGEDGTWYTGQEALEAGLVDEITGGEEVDDSTVKLLTGWIDKLPESVRNTLPENAPEEENEEHDAPDSPDTEEQETTGDEESVPTENDGASEHRHSMSMLLMLSERGRA